MIDKYRVLKEYFGHDTFREGQEQLVDSLLSGTDALGIMPTGAGKSVCYQIPALIFDGVTLVISPLISLMKDQVSALIESGVAAAYVNSSLTQVQYSRVLDNIRIGKYKIIYVAPERLSTPSFMSVCESIHISMIAIDEAHCVSQWGQDFRPSYLKISDFVSSLPVRPVVGAFTATATDEVKRDIVNLLKLNDPCTITTGFDRPNLFFGVMKPQTKSIALMRLVRERRQSTGIVYCSTRKAVEEVCDLLCKNGFSATRYHAGLSEQERRVNQDDFIYDRKQIMVATNAFGMGIDKSNVSFVIHYNMPQNIESYYQEAGRAGRDGEPADCILLYSPKDVHTNEFLINNSEPNPYLSEDEQSKVRKRDLERLKFMTFYCTTTDCLRGFILKYFGDHAAHHCGNCSNCLSEFETVDITVDAQKIMSCVARTGQRYGKKMICDVLRGSKSEIVLAPGLDMQSTYGIMADCPETRLREIIDYLCNNKYLLFEGNEYPVLKLTAKSREVLSGSKTLTAKLASKHQESKKIRELHDVDDSLLAALKKLRLTIAMRQSVPAYVVFTDAALVEMCRVRPTTPEDFLSISGVGNAKLEKYGKKFMDAIAEFNKSNK